MATSHRRNSTPTTGRGAAGPRAATTGELVPSTPCIPVRTCSKLEIRFVSLRVVYRKGLMNSRFVLVQIEISSKREGIFAYRFDHFSISWSPRISLPFVPHVLVGIKERDLESLVWISRLIADPSVAKWGHRPPLKF
jgi:hypothetical protein